MLLYVVLLAGLLAAPAVARGQDATPIAPELDGLGTLRFAVSTANPRAQRFFDQGLRLTYAFNHAAGTQ